MNRSCNRLVRLGLMAALASLATCGNAAAQDARKAAAFVAAARAAQEDGDLDKAFELAEQAVEADAKSYDARVLLGELYVYSSDEYAKAITHLSRAVELSDRPVEALSIRADAYLWSWDIAKALADAGRLIALEPAEGDHYLTRSSILADAGAFDEALADIRKAVELGPKDDVDLLFELAWALEQADRLDEALKAADRLIELDGEDAFAYDLRATLRARAGRFDEAMADAEKAIRHDGLFSTRGDVKMIQGRFAAAAADYTVALSHDAQDEWSRQMRAIAHIAAGKSKEAIEDIEALERLDSGGLATVLRGDLYFVSGRYSEAAEAYARSARDLPFEPMLQLSLTLASRLAGQKQAQETLKTWVDTLPHKEGRDYAWADLALGRTTIEAYLKKAEAIRSPYLKGDQIATGRLVQAVAAIEAGRNGEAADRLDEAVRAAPGDSWIRTMAVSLRKSMQDKDKSQ